MFTITNTNTNEETKVKTQSEVKKALRKIVKDNGGRQALKGVYIYHPKSGTWYAQDITL